MLRVAEGLIRGAVALLRSRPPAGMNDEGGAKDKSVHGLPGAQSQQARVPKAATTAPAGTGKSRSAMRRRRRKQAAADAAAEGDTPGDTHLQLGDGSVIIGDLTEFGIHNGSGGKLDLKALEETAVDEALVVERQAEAVRSLVVESDVVKGASSSGPLAERAAESPASCSECGRWRPMVRRLGVCDGCYRAVLDG